MSENTNAAAALIAAAVVAHPGKVNHIPTVATWLHQVSALAHHLDLIGGAEVEGYEGTGTQFPATIDRVAKITKGHPPHEVEKARVYYWPANDPDADEPEMMETLPLSNQFGRMTAETARANVQKRVLIHKRNRHDADGKVTQGFRELVWITPLEQPPPDPAAPNRTGEYTRDAQQPDWEAGAEAIRANRERLAGAAQDQVDEQVDRITEAREERADNSPEYDPGEDPF